ncbi:hypothetical protein [Corynebacterium kefirresidentii]
MGCGWGACFSCAVPLFTGSNQGTELKPLCTTGPILDLSSVDWSCLD